MAILCRIRMYLVVGLTHQAGKVGRKNLDHETVNKEVKNGNGVN
jgi:hypothetical protein